MATQWDTSDKDGNVHILNEHSKNRIMMMEKLYYDIPKLFGEVEGIKKSILVETDEEKKGVLLQDLELKESQLQTAASEFRRMKAGLRSELEAVKTLKGWECNEESDIISLFVIRRVLDMNLVAFLSLPHLKEEKFNYLREAALHLDVTVNRFRRRTDPEVEEAQETSPSPPHNFPKFDDHWYYKRD